MGGLRSQRCQGGGSPDMSEEHNCFRSALVSFSKTEPWEVFLIVFTGTCAAWFCAQLLCAHCCGRSTHVTMIQPMSETSLDGVLCSAPSVPKPEGAPPSMQWAEALPTRSDSFFERMQ